LNLKIHGNYKDNDSRDSNTMGQPSLFDAEELYEFPKDLLEYKEHFLSREEADLLKELLLKNTPWEQRTQKMYDKMVLTQRLTAWYGDNNSYDLDGNVSGTNSWTLERIITYYERRLTREMGTSYCQICNTYERTDKFDFPLD
jgi:alkylated DNA repair dioxygenase AlkB